MKKLNVVVLALATALATAPAAMADSFTINISGAPVNLDPVNGNPNSNNGPGITGSGTLTGSLISGSAYNITSGSLTVTIGGTDTYTATVIQNLSSPSVSAVTVSTLSYDETYTSTGSSHVSAYPGGLIFTLSGSGAWNGDTLEIFYDNVEGTYYYGNVLWDIWNTAGTDAIINNLSGGDPLTITPTPEPSSLLLFGTGLFGMAGFLVRKAKLGMSRAA